METLTLEIIEFWLSMFLDNYLIETSYDLIPLMAEINS